VPDGLTRFKDDFDSAEFPAAAPGFGYIDSLIPE
jgi:hypothetical protein